MGYPCDYNGYLKTFSLLSSGESLVEIESRFNTIGKLIEINCKKPFAYFFKTEKDLEEINGLFKQ